MLPDFGQSKLKAAKISSFDDDLMVDPKVSWCPFCLCGDKLFFQCKKIQMNAVTLHQIIEHINLYENKYTQCQWTQNKNLPQLASLLDNEL